MEIKSFEDLECWKKARGVRIDIHQMTKNFPSEEKFRLSDQMIRASRSVTANISEGFGRFHFQENIQFCRMARGSLFELQDHLTVAPEQRFISDSAFLGLRAKISDSLKVLNEYINYLIKAKSTQKPPPDNQ